LDVELIYRPDLSLSQTVRIDSGRLVAQGKVARLVETFDFESGAPSLSLGLAISRSGDPGRAVTDSPLVAPVAPPEPAEPASPAVSSMQYHLGGHAISPPDSDDFRGYVDNYLTREVPVEALYKRRFVAAAPEIEASAREPQTRPQAETYLVDIPDDELTLTTI